MYPNPRIVYSIAKDGLIFKFFSKVLSKFKTPAVATVTTGLITGNLGLNHIENCRFMNLI